MKNTKKIRSLLCTCAMMLSTFSFTSVQVKAAIPFKGSISKVDSVTLEGNVAKVSFNDGALSGKITFLENGIFRYNVDPTNEFTEYAKPNEASHAARIQAQPDDSSSYARPSATKSEDELKFTVSNGNVTIQFEKNTGRMSVLNKDGQVVVNEKAPLELGATTKQTLATDEKETFYGGGTQNGRFAHKGEIIDIENNNKYTDGGVTSPNPFYWSSAGYGVMRNTFSSGAYDFAKTNPSNVVTSHSEAEYDAYYFVSDKTAIDKVAQDVLKEYYKVTGDPVLLPEYGFYLGHLNCYNRDGWQTKKTSLKNEKDGIKEWTLEDGNKYWEHGMRTGYVLSDEVESESLNGHGPNVSAENIKALGYSKKYSAQGVIDGHIDKDMPLGWFLPNDGYGCGYGQNGYEKTEGDSPERTAAIDANVANLKEFSDYANTKGVQSGLWTQSQLTPAQSGSWQTLRDFEKEVKDGGVRTLKTDVAWVGAGYSFGLDGTKTAYNTITETNSRPNIISLDGWAGSQRYVSIWSGDQYGGNWEYIRFHIPTYIGQGLSGNPNIGSDMDGIFSGEPIIATRDYQWKAFTPQILDMDGWGSLAKKPYYSGDPYTSINRMYLKLKAELMPYTYTAAHAATGRDKTSGKPMVRAMFLEYPDDPYAKSKDLQYQYMYGDNFLVAPIYQETAANNKGDDIRNNIYLPDEDETWIDYLSGKQYRGNTTVNNYDAPLWKLPLFVKNGSIVPMYEENNNPSAKSTANEKGLDKTKRRVEFWPSNKETTYDLYEDDGMSMENNKTTDSEYGTIENVSYGPSVATKFTSKVENQVATLTANASTGSYNNYNSNRSTTFVANVSQKPTAITAKNGESNLNVVEATTLDEYNTLSSDETKTVYYFDAAPNLNKYAKAEEEFSQTAITTTPKLYVHFEKTDVAINAQTLTIEGFVNDGGLGKNEINGALAAPSNLTCPEEGKTPTSLALSWDKVDQAESYELMVDGIINQVGDVNTFTNVDLVYNSTHTYQIRARNLDGYSQWSEKLTTQTLQDPWRNVPDSKVTWNGGEQYGKITNAFDHNFQTMFHSSGSALNDDFIIDLQKAYELDEFEYYPRGSGGSGEGSVGVRNNGTVTNMDVYTSMDGAHWNKQQDGKATTWTYTAGKSIEESVQKVKLSGAARYVKLRVVASIGNFFAANQLAVYKKDGSSGFALGSNTMKPEVSEGDITNMNNYLAVANRANEAPTFDAQIKKHYADLNNNDIYDVYDYAFTLFNVDGGTQQKGKVDGNILIIPSKKNVAVGEEFTIDFYGSDLKNINAFGAWFDYDPNKFEYVDIEKGSNIASMGNYSMNKLYNDGTAMYNLAMANRGNKQTLSGDGLLASIKMRAKVAGEAFVPTKSTIIGPTFDFKEIDCSQSIIEIPDIPLSKESLYPKENFDLSMTNDKLATDDGTNVNKLIHNNTYDGLFDAAENDFEFKWNLGAEATDEETLAYRKEWVKLPTTIHYKFKKEDSLHKIKLTNRSNLGNGAISGLLYTIHFTDGTSESKEFTTKNLTYEYLLKDNTKIVKQVDIELRGANNGDKALTLSQIELSRLDTQVIEGVELDAKNTKEIFVNDVTTTKATVKPDGIANPYYKVSSSDESIVSVLTIQDSTGIQYFLKGNTVGKAIITVSAAGDLTKSTSYEVNVKQGISTKVLDDAIQIGMTYSDVYTSKTYQDLQDAIKAGEKLLENANFTKEEINKAATDIEVAIINLVIRPIDESKLINTDAKTKISIKDFSSERGPGSGDPSLASSTLDYDESTFWHTDYSASLGMPQHITLDLKGKYKVNNVSFLPRQNASNGDIIKAHIETSSDYNTWSKYPSETFENDGSSLLNRTVYKVLTLPKSEARYVRFVIENTLGNENDQYASMAEIRVYGEYTGAKKDSLQKLYDENVSKTNEGYTPSSWATFTNTLIDAKKLLDDDNATQKNVDEGLKNLQSSIDKLQKMADFTKLKATIDQANGIKSKLYTAASYNEVYKALAKANQLVIDFNATQENVDAAKDALSEAILGLVLVAANPISPSIPNDAIMNPDGTITMPNADKNMSITGDIDVDASFVTTTLDAKQMGDLKKKIKDQDFLKNYKIEKVYDISIMKNGNATQNPGKKTIRILLDELLMNKSMQVVYIAEDGTIQFMESRQNGDYIEFDTTHNSYYALVSKTNSNTVNTGDTTMIGAMLFIFIMSGAALLLIVNNKRKKQ